MNAALEIVAPGIATTVQDGGRPGLAHLGVPTSGFVDPALAGVVNRLVGNPVDAALLETCGNLRVRAMSALLVASSTEPAPRTLPAGHEFEVRADRFRLWHYLAIRGAIDVEPVLGSRSRDTLSGIGPSPVIAGERLPIGPEPDLPITADVAPLPARGELARITSGPRAEWFEPDWRTDFAGSAWTITSASRVGVRLSGRKLVRTIRTELPSEGLVRGAIQVPHDGDPVMMLADHPTTGGYPVIAVVDPDDVAIVAQHLPGEVVRFRLRA
jgi:biotin-dependent carboxylase-like uncharacterized protein